MFWPASKEMIDEPSGRIDLPLVQDLFNVPSTKHEYPGSRAFHATNPPNSTTVVIGCRPPRSHILICGIHVLQADTCTAAAKFLRTTDTSCFRELCFRQLETTTIYRNIEQLVSLDAEHERLKRTDPLEARFFASEIILDLSGPLLHLWGWRLSCHSLVLEKDFV